MNNCTFHGIVVLYNIYIKYFFGYMGIWVNGIQKQAATAKAKYPRSG
jgi:hypothetical protein